MIREEQIQEFRGILLQQTELLTALSQQEQHLQAVVADRDWPQLERLLPSMEAVGVEFQRLETRRQVVYTEMQFAAGGEQSFAALLKSFPGDEREKISAAYRGLKVAVLRLRSQTAGLDTYLRSSIGTLRGVLQELYPEHASTVYSRDGFGGYPSGQAMVLSRHA